MKILRIIFRNVILSIFGFGLWWILYPICQIVLQGTMYRDLDSYFDFMMDWMWDK